MNYGDFVRRHSRRSPRKAAVIDRGAATSYAELDHRTDGLAGALAALGAVSGDRVVFLGENGHAPFEVMIACAKAGLVYVPIDFRLNEGEVFAILADCSPKIMIVDMNHMPIAEAIRSKVGPETAWVLHADQPRPGYENYEALIAKGIIVQERCNRSDDQLLCVLYTSGTTGRAKGVQLTHAASTRNGLALAKGYGVDSESRFLMSLPYSATGVVNHSSGPTLMMGGTVVFDEVRKFEARRYFATVESQKVTHSQLVPTMMYRLLDSPDRPNFDLSSLRTIGYGSAPIPAHRIRSLIESFGPVFIQAYGMTETCSLATILTSSEHEVVGTDREHILASCGRAVPEVELRILSDDGRELPAGEVGEVAIRAPWLTAGYWGDPVQTRHLLRDGWLYTGDLARLDNEEFLYIVDRKKDTVTTGGSKVYCPEVEAVIYAMEGVSEVAVIGIPDEQWGERVHAVVVLQPGSTLTEAMIIDHCAKYLSKYKCPKDVEFADEIPKTTTGKHAKNVLRRRLSAFATGA